MQLTLVAFLLLISMALITSVISGMFGLAGGLIFLAVITTTVETSYIIPLHAAVQLISNCSRLAFFYKHIRWTVIRYFLVGLIPGSFLGILIFALSPLGIIKMLIGFFILLATFMPETKRERSFDLGIFVPVGFVTGVFGIFIGATGPFTASFFIRRDILKENLIATKGTCQAISHLIKIPLFGFVGANILPYWKTFIFIGPVIVLGTYMGKKLVGKISEKDFKLAFRVIISLIALAIIIPEILNTFS